MLNAVRSLTRSKVGFSRDAGVNSYGPIQQAYLTKGTGRNRFEAASSRAKSTIG